MISACRSDHDERDPRQHEEREDDGVDQEADEACSERSEVRVEVDPAVGLDVGHRGLLGALRVDRLRERRADDRSGGHVVVGDLGQQRGEVVIGVRRGPAGRRLGRRWW